mmetsp:Transcript_18795/g.49945  ORF Transcript_18795/g.49945 Transcript_18795/m.49945 type:complete len:410 (+) Transcript_18795:71-1300(+)
MASPEASLVPPDAAPIGEKQRAWQEQRRAWREDRDARKPLPGRACYCPRSLAMAIVAALSLCIGIAVPESHPQCQGSHPQCHVDDHDDDSGELSSFLMHLGKRASPRDKMSLNFAASPTAQHAERRGVAVCIVGQEARLEHLSKVENVLKPLHDHSGHGGVSTFVVLQQGQAQFSNKPLAMLLQQSVMDFPRRMEALLGPSYTDGLAPAPVNLTDERISTLLKSWPRLRTDRPNRKERFRNYLNQFKNMHTCMDLVKAAEARRGASFEFVLKLRDDSIALKPFSWSSLRSTKFKACSGWGGVNDKVAVLLREHADTYMRQPYKFMLEVIAGNEEEVEDARTVGNTEGLISRVLHSHGVNYSLVDADEIPWVDGRLQDDGRWCVVKSGKDCHPSRPWKVTGVETCSPPKK